MDMMNVAMKLKRLRQSQDLTVAQLADKSGFSKAFISRVENFRISPSLNALGKITAALGISMSELFQDQDGSPEYVVCKKNNGEPVVRDQSDKHGMKYFSLAYQKLDRKMNPFLIEYRRCRKPRPMLMHDDDEFFALIEGEADFVISEPGNRIRMTEGDTIYLSRNIPHTVELPTPVKLARALVVYC